MLRPASGSKGEGLETLPPAAGYLPCSIKRKDMKSIKITVILAVVLGLSLVGAGWAASPTTANNTGNQQIACPFHSGKVNKEVSTDNREKQDYYCGSTCMDSFKRAPDSLPALPVSPEVN